MRVLDRQSTEEGRRVHRLVAEPMLVLRMRETDRKIFKSSENDMPSSVHMKIY